MRTLNAKEFNWRGIPCVRFGDVEMPVSEAEEHLKNGRNCILCRTHAYRFEARTEDEKTFFVYNKVATESRQNTLPHRYYVLDENGIKNYLKEKK